MRRLTVTLLSCLLGVGTCPAVTAQSPSPSPTQTTGPAGQRVVVPTAGIALTLPADWSVQLPMEELEYLPPGLMAKLTTPFSLWTVLHSLTPLEYPDAGSIGCDIVLTRIDGAVLEPGGTALRVGEERLTLDRLLTIAWTEPESDGSHTMSRILLPAGPSERRDIIEHDDVGDWYLTEFHLVVPVGVATLSCLGFEESAADDGLAIAETIEFVPSEEQGSRPPRPGVEPP
jgi:hypothetical protein